MLCRVLWGSTSEVLSSSEEEGAVFLAIAIVIAVKHGYSIQVENFLKKFSKNYPLTTGLGSFGFVQPLGREGCGLEMVAIPGGRFLMGSSEEDFWHSPEEAPQHRVKVPDFYLGKYPVTQAQWKAIAFARPKIKRELNCEPSRFRGDDLPVDRVNWDEAVEFCARLTQLVGGKVHYRLPSEAEWEYACRAGTTTAFHCGNIIYPKHANCRFSSIEPKIRLFPRQTTPVGQFPPNPFGLYDMHGQVWEWCEDDWHKNYINAPVDGSPWLNRITFPFLPVKKSVRGGCWNDYVGDCHSTSRRGKVTTFMSTDGDYTGFRIACSQT
jgi:formylglycine-generating enzyme required for sulfatase activity